MEHEVSWDLTSEGNRQGGRDASSCRLEGSKVSCRVMIPPWGACWASAACWHGWGGHGKSGLVQTPGFSWVRMWPCRNTVKGLHQGHDLLVTPASYASAGRGTAQSSRSVWEVMLLVQSNSCCWDSISWELGKPYSGSLARGSMTSLQSVGWVQLSRAPGGDKQSL